MTRSGIDLGTSHLIYLVTSLFFVFSLSSLCLLGSLSLWSRVVESFTADSKLGRVGSYTLCISLLGFNHPPTPTPPPPPPTPPRTEPWGIPLVTFLQAEYCPLMTTRCCLCSRNERIQSSNNYSDHYPSSDLDVCCSGNVKMYWPILSLVLVMKTLLGVYSFYWDVSRRGDCQKQFV